MGAIHQRFPERLQAGWPRFLRAREEHLPQDGRFGDAAEKVTENILADLFTMAMDWRPGELNHQIGYADLVLSTFGLKRLVIEAKRPHALLGSRYSINSAIDQVIRYAARQSVKRIAISDGSFLFAADYENGSAKKVHLRDWTIRMRRTLCGGERQWYLRNGT